MRIFPLVFLFVICYAIYLLSVQLLFGEHHLIEIKGQLLKKYHFVQKDTLGNGQITEHAVLSFMLADNNRFFILKANIDGVTQGSRIFSGVNMELDNAGQIVVMIKRSDLTLVRPKVYTIYADGKNVFDRVKKPIKNVQLYGSTAILAYCSAWYTCSIKK